jgi:hypothetical protein
MHVHHWLAATGFVLSAAGLGAAVPAGHPDTAARVAHLDAPQITGVDPVPARGSSPQTVTILGAGFRPGLTLDVTTPNGQTTHLDGPAIAATRDASFQVTVLFAVAGKYSLVVTNPDGGASKPFTLDVRAAPTAPALDRITPDHVSPSPQPQAFQLSGARFARGAAVVVTDPAGNVITVSGGAIRNATPTSLEVSVRLAVAGEYGVSVENPSGEMSNALTVVVSGR